MTHTSPTLLLLAALAAPLACAADEPPATQPATQPADTQPATTAPATTTVVTEDPLADRTLDWLDKLERRGAKLVSYQATVVYTKDQTEQLGDKQTRLGSVAYLAAVPAKPADQATTQPAATQPDTAAPRDAKFAITFTDLVANRRKIKDERRYIFDGEWLVEIHTKRKQFFKRQIVAPGERFNPLELGKGPFPMPLGQKRHEVLRLFEVELVEDVADKPLHMRLTPRLNAAGKPTSEFTKVDLWYDRGTLLPTKIVTRDDYDTITTVLLKDEKIDALKPDEAQKLFDTTTPAPGTGWRVEIKPWVEPQKPQ